MKIIIKLLERLSPSFFFDSSKYWENRYLSGGNSGPGTYRHLAEFKASFINSFLKAHKIKSVIEWGCGDGNQLSIIEYPNYIGVDVSPTTIEACKRKFEGDITKHFYLLSEAINLKADLSLSLDVIFHLTEDKIFNDYMNKLFSSGTKYVVIYSSNATKVAGHKKSIHVRHRKFSDWIEKNQKEWELDFKEQNKYPFNGDYNNTSFCDFYIYRNKRLNPDV